jgi:hypothetical protein
MEKYSNWDKFLKLPLFSLMIFHNRDIVIKLKKYIYFIENSYREDWCEPYDIADFEVYDKLSILDKNIYSYYFDSEYKGCFKNVNLPKFNKKLPLYFVKVRELTDKRKYDYYYSLAIMDEDLKWSLVKPYAEYGLVPYYLKSNQDVLSWIRTDIYLD